MIMDINLSKSQKRLSVSFLSVLAICSAMSVAKNNLKGNINEIKHVGDPNYVDAVGFTTADPRVFVHYIGKPRENIILNVPDYSAQYFMKNGEKTTCAAVACTNILNYWGNFFKALAPSNLLELHNQMLNILNSKTIDNEIGSDKTSINLILQRYIKSKGLNAQSNYFDSKYYTTARQKEELWKIINQELKNKRPLLGAIHTFGSSVENHEVVITGAIEGYVLNKDGTTKLERYLVINDGSDTTKNTTYSRFGGNSISITTLNIAG